MAQIRKPAQTRLTGIPWLDALIGDPQAGMPGPAAMTSPLRYVPMGAESGAPNWVMQAIRNVLGRQAKQMPGQPPAGMAPTAQMIPPAGLVGASVARDPQLLTVADRIRQYGSIQPAPMHMQGGSGQTLPSEPLMGLMEQIRQALSLSSRQ